MSGSSRPTLSKVPSDSSNAPPPSSATSSSSTSLPPLIVIGGPPPSHSTTLRRASTGQFHSLQKTLGNQHKGNLKMTQMPEVAKISSDNTIPPPNHPPPHLPSAVPPTSQIPSHQIPSHSSVKPERPLIIEGIVRQRMKQITSNPPSPLPLSPTASLPLSLSHDSSLSSLLEKSSNGTDSVVKRRVKFAEGGGNPSDLDYSTGGGDSSNGVKFSVRIDGVGPPEESKENVRHPSISLGIPKQRASQMINSFTQMGTQQTSPQKSIPSQTINHPGKIRDLAAFLHLARIADPSKSEGSMGPSTLQEEINFSVASARSQYAALIIQHAQQAALDQHWKNLAMKGSKGEGRGGAAGNSTATKDGAPPSPILPAAIAAALSHTANFRGGHRSSLLPQMKSPGGPAPSLFKLRGEDGADGGGEGEKQKAMNMQLYDNEEGEGREGPQIEAMGSIEEEGAEVTRPRRGGAGAVQSSPSSVVSSPSIFPTPSKDPSTLPPIDSSISSPQHSVDPSMFLAASAAYARFRRVLKQKKKYLDRSRAKTAAMEEGAEGGGEGREGKEDGNSNRLPSNTFSASLSAATSSSPGSPSHSDEEDGDTIEIVNVDEADILSPTSPPSAFSPLGSPNKTSVGRVASSPNTLRFQVVRPSVSTTTPTQPSSVSSTSSFLSSTTPSLPSSPFPPISPPAPVSPTNRSRQGTATSFVSSSPLAMTPSSSFNTFGGVPLEGAGGGKINTPNAKGNSTSEAVNSSSVVTPVSSRSSITPLGSSSSARSSTLKLSVNIGEKTPLKDNENDKDKDALKEKDKNSTKTLPSSSSSKDSANRRLSAARKPKILKSILKKTVNPTPTEPSSASTVSSPSHSTSSSSSHSLSSPSLPSPSPPLPRRTVRFVGQVSTREFPLIQGGSSSVPRQGGFSLGLDWGPFQQKKGQLDTGFGAANNSRAHYFHYPAPNPSDELHRISEDKRKESLLEFADSPENSLDDEEGNSLETIRTSRLAQFCSCRPPPLVYDDDGNCLHDPSLNYQCCVDPSVCQCVRDGMNCHSEGNDFCRCTGPYLGPENPVLPLKINRSDDVPRACGNPFGKYEFDEYSVRQHTIEIIYNHLPAEDEDREEEDDASLLLDDPSLSHESSFASSPEDDLLKIVEEMDLPHGGMPRANSFSMNSHSSDGSGTESLSAQSSPLGGPTESPGVPIVPIDSLNSLPQTTSPTSSNPSSFSLSAFALLQSPNLAMSASRNRHLKDVNTPRNPAASGSFSFALFPNASHTPSTSHTPVMTRMSSMTVTASSPTSPRYGKSGGSVSIPFTSKGNSDAHGNAHRHAPPLSPPAKSSARLPSHPLSLHAFHRHFIASAASAMAAASAEQKSATRGNSPTKNAFSVTAELPKITKNTQNTTLSPPTSTNSSVSPQHFDVSSSYKVLPLRPLSRRTYSSGEIDFHSAAFFGGANPLGQVIDIDDEKGGILSDDGDGVQLTLPVLSPSSSVSSVTSVSATNVKESGNIFSL